MEPALLASRLIVDFGDVRAVDGFDLSVGAGASVALVGRNGAGKWLYATKRGERPLIGVAGDACQCTVRQSRPTASSSRRR